MKKVRLLLYIIIIFLNFSTSHERARFNSFDVLIPKITIKINSSGAQKIFSSSYEYYPNLTIINNITHLDNHYSNIYNFTESFNIIELSWYYNLTNCSKMFSFCDAITEVDLSEFIGDDVKSYNYMFEECTSLTSIEISNLNTSSSNMMKYMFAGCSKINFINLSEVNATYMNHMDYMFSGCTSLLYLDFSNFNFKNLFTSSYMFNNCEKLKYINLFNSKNTTLRINEDTFDNTPERIIFCSNELNHNFITIKPNSINNCSDEVFHSKSQCKNNKCLLCTEQSDNIGLCLICKDGYVKVNYDNSSFYDCILKVDPILNKFYLNETLNVYKPCYERCSSCVEGGNIKHHNCLGCIEGYNLNLGHKMCIGHSEYYYILNNEYHKLDIYQCPNEAQFYLKENNSCIDDCKKDNLYSVFFFGNCLEKCPERTINDNSKCKINNSKQCLSLDNELKFDITIIENIYYLIKSYLYEFNYTNNFVAIYKNNRNSLYVFKNISCIENLDIHIPHFGECYMKILYYLNMREKDILSAYLKNGNNTVQNKFLFFNATSGEELDIGNLCDFIEEAQIQSEGIDELNITKIISEFDGNTLLFKDLNKIYQISFLKNQIENLSIVNLGHCETILKTENGIDLSEDLIIFKTEYIFPEFKIPIIDYEIFDQKDNRLYLNCCSNVSINYEIPVEINEDEIYKYDPNSFYYNDKCHPVESDNNIDLTIYDRKNDYNEKNMSLCQINCDFKGYNNKTKKANCECNAKNKLPFDDIFNVDKDKLIKKFLNVKDIMNIDVVKCYKLIFYENGLQKNSGSYILLSIILITIITLIILALKEFNNIKTMLGNMLQNKKIMGAEKNAEIKIFTKNNQVHNPNKKRKKNSFTNNQTIKSKSKSALFSSSEIKENNLNNLNDNIKEKIQEIKKDEILINEHYNDYEINNLSYDKAIINDKRTYWEYYLSLIKTKQLLILSFYLSTDYNLKTVKINLFFLTFALNLTVNACFFNDSTMHKIYKDDGSYNFLFQLPQIIYSLLISIIIKTVLSMLSLTEKGIVKLKQMKEIDHNKIIKEIKYIKIKLIIFFVLEFIFLVLFWYYLSCFCALYKNTQSHLIKDTLTSFVLSLFYPFALNLIPGLFRISALKAKNKDSKCLYAISKILQLI